MLSLIKDIVRPVYRFATSRSYRTYQQLFSRYLKYPRFQKTTIRFLDYTIEVPDALSFIYQYKEIYLDESYRFELTKKNPVIYDCGANVGISCLYFKSLFPECSLYAFEADPKIFEYLSKNILNNLPSTNVKLTNKAIWVNDDGVSFSGNGADGGAITEGGSNVVNVPSVRLRDLLAGEKHIDLLKLDIEGAETAVLKDCDGKLEHVDRIFFEYHSYRNQSQQLNQLLEVMTRNGFRYFIQSVQSVKSPFLPQAQDDAMDLQLNVYCEKKK